MPMLPSLREIRRLFTRRYWNRDFPFLVRRAYHLYLRHSRTGILAWPYHLWTERITELGRITLMASVATVVAGLFHRNMVGSVALSAFMALFVIASMYALVRRLPVMVVRTAPERCVAGAVVPVTLEVRNGGRWDMTEIGGFEYRLPPGLTLRGPIQYAASIAPGASHKFNYEMQAHQRGCYTLPGPSAVSTAPLGLMHARRYTPQPRKLLVHPAFTPLVEMRLPAGARHQPGGIPLTSLLGHSTEFYGLRGYQPGDRLADLHARSWARVGYPVIRQYQEEYLTRVAVLVDTYIPRGSSAAAMEASLSMVAAVADYLARQEYVVDLVAAGPQLYYLQAGRSLGYLNNILDILACLERSPRDPLDQIGPQFARELQQISTAVLVLLSFDETRQAFIRTLRNAGVQVTCLLITEGDAEVAPGSGTTVLTVDDVEKGVRVL